MSKLFTKDETDFRIADDTWYYKSQLNKLFIDDQLTIQLTDSDGNSTNNLLFNKDSILVLEILLNKLKQGLQK